MNDGFLSNKTDIEKGERLSSVHAMKAYRGVDRAPLILNLGNRWR
jgi:hypothetical protein